MTPYERWQKERFGNILVDSEQDEDMFEDLIQPIEPDEETDIQDQY